MAPDEQRITQATATISDLDGDFDGNTNYGNTIYGINMRCDDEDASCHEREVNLVSRNGPGGIRREEKKVQMNPLLRNLMRNAKAVRDESFYSPWFKL